MAQPTTSVSDFDYMKSDRTTRSDVSQPRRRTIPYLGVASVVGGLGALSVAAFVFVLDWVAGQPLATPNVLGAKLFLGENLAYDAGLRPALVFGYTLIHTIAFVIAASAAVSTQKVLTSRGTSLNTQFVAGAAAMFVGLEALFGALLSLIGGIESIDFGSTRIAAANAIAALTMAAAIYIRAHTHWRKPSEDDDA
jgi:hypothetical protein